MNMFNRTLRMLLVMAFAAVALVGLNGTAAADSEANGGWEFDYSYDQNDGDKGGRSIKESAFYKGASTNMAKFEAYGEVLKISYYFENDRRAIAKLWVGGSGPAIFYSDGDMTDTRFNLSYDEGQTVYLQVCTSDHPNAVCTSKTKYKGVS